MLFPNLAEQAVERAKQDYMDKVSRMWRKGRALAIQYHNGLGYLDYQNLIDEDLREQIPLSNNNIVKRIIERVSLVYTIPPVRTVGDDPAEKYLELVPRINTSLQRVERMTNLLNLVAVKPTVYGEGKDRHIEFDMLTDFDAFFDSDPMKPSGISYPLQTKSGSNEPEVLMYVDAGGWRKFHSDGKVVEEGEHNYGILPVYFNFTDRPETEFLDVDYARDLIDACREINTLSMDRTANVRFQSYGYLWAAGVQHDQVIVTAPNKVLTFDDPQASLNLTTPPDTQQSTTDTINAIYKQIARNWHLPEDFVEGSAAVESGRAIQLRNQELTDDRQGDIERCREMELGLYEICQKIAPVDFKRQLAGELSVDFQEKQLVESEEDRRARWEWEVDKGFKSWAEILFSEVNPDRFESVEEAQAYIDQNRKAGKTPSVIGELLGAGGE